MKQKMLVMPQVTTTMRPNSKSQKILSGKACQRLMPPL